MNLIITNTDNTPIYSQVYTQIKNKITTNQLVEGDILPSIRQLAKDLKISVITTKRAYDELEKDGYVYSVSGKGTYVAKQNTEILRETNLKLIEEHLLKILDLAKGCDLTKQDLIEMIDLLEE